MLYLNYKKINDYDYKFSKIGKYNIQILFKSSLTNTNNMFSYCSSLTSLNLYNFNTNNVTDMGEMFSKCSSLTTLNLSNFIINNITDMRSIFFGLNKNCKIICNNEKIKRIKF